MNRCQPYRLVHPLTGIWPSYGDAISYRYVSPAGDEWRNNQHLGARHVSATPPRWEDYGHTVFTASPPQCADATTTLHSPFSILNSSFSHTFSAKERDAETGLSYFGARYYSSDLSIWLSIDPQAAKYPSLSPYVYCADNPVKLVDPNGEEIVIEWKGSQYRYEKDGTLTHIGGNELDERQLNRFVNKAKQSLNKINKTSEGKRMISDLQESSTKYTIKAGQSGYEKKGQAPNSITWNSGGTRLPVKGTPFGEYNPTCDLAHELSHAFDDNNSWNDCNKVDGLKKCEWVACYRENLIRKELGYEYRTHYEFYQDQDGHFLGGKEPELLYDNKPFLPFDINTYEKR